MLIISKATKVSLSAVIEVEFITAIMSVQAGHTASVGTFLK